MIGSSSTDPSASSRAEFNGVMIIESITTAPGKPKTLYITGAFYATLGILWGIFRYFNNDDLIFKPESRWFVNTTVSLCFNSPFVYFNEI